MLAALLVGGWRPQMNLNGRPTQKLWSRSSEKRPPWLSEGERRPSGARTGEILAGRHRRVLVFVRIYGLTAVAHQIEVGAPGRQARDLA